MTQRAFPSKCCSKPCCTLLYAAPWISHWIGKHFLESSYWFTLSLTNFAQKMVVYCLLTFLTVGLPWVYKKKEISLVICQQFMEVKPRIQCKFDVTDDVGMYSIM